MSIFAVMDLFSPAHWRFVGWGASFEDLDEDRDAPRP